VSALLQRQIGFVPVASKNSSGLAKRYATGMLDAPLAILQAEYREDFQDNGLAGLDGA